MVANLRVAVLKRTATHIHPAAVSAQNAFVKGIALSGLKD
jgi:hypothetical protein